MPIVLLVRRKRFEDAGQCSTSLTAMCFAEETPEFIARNLVSRLTRMPRH
jgi:hypothetical protein